jgi:outer membrane protein TolC
MSLPLGSMPRAHTAADMIGCAVMHAHDDAGDRGTRTAAPAKFFHAPRVVTAVDETVLASWWRQFADPELDRLVDATCEQGFEVCAASLRLQHACECADDLAAICDYYDVRIRQIAATVREYFAAACLRERIACVDAEIAAEAASRRVRAKTENEHTAGHDETPRPALMAELHAHRIRLCTHWDVGVIALARQTAQPLDLLIERLRYPQLPAASAEMPALGEPDDLVRRRPDLLAAMGRVAGVDAASGHAARLQRLDAEQRRDLAEKQVELALATLAGTQAELIPVRAAMAAADARYQRLCRHAAKGRTSQGHVAETHTIDPRDIADARCALYAIRDREIETRGRTYLALVDVFLAAGCGWPALIEPALIEPTLIEPAFSESVSSASGESECSP